MTSPKTRSIAVIGAVAAATLTAPLAAAGTGHRPPHMRATIVRDAVGTPTIEATGYRGLGYGYGYAVAQDNLCTLADAYVTYRAQRSRWFGPDALSPDGNRNVDSDLYVQAGRDRHEVAAMLHRPPPQGPTRDARELIDGYVAGYNAYLRHTGVAHLPDPRCRGKRWVSPITAADAYMLYSGVSGPVDGIAQAAPPGPGRTRAADVTTARGIERQLAGMHARYDRAGRGGSNGWALGSRATANHSGMVLANPHFPWHGPLRFYQMHLVIPGHLNASGANTLGAPTIGIGHTSHLAWTDTVSMAYTYVPVQLTLVPGDPTSYLVDGHRVAMRRQRVTVSVRRRDGRLIPVTRTLYSTRYGPVTDEVPGLPRSAFAWTRSTAFAYASDANHLSSRLLNGDLANQSAQSVGQIVRDLRTYEAYSGLNTIAADAHGRAAYADINAVPNVTDATARRCDTALGRSVFARIGLPVLDGSRSTCAPRRGHRAAAAGLMSPDRQPVLDRRDYVANSNDSYWLANPAHPLEGYPTIIGDERGPQHSRTLLGLDMIRRRLAGRDGLPGDRFTLPELQTLTFQDRDYVAESWRAPIVRYCRAHPVMSGSNGPVDVRRGCRALAGWDTRMNLSSRGALLFQRLVDRLHPRLVAYGGRDRPLPGGEPASVSTHDDTTAASGRFDPRTNPLAGPPPPPTGRPVFARAFADAVTDLRRAGLSAAAPLGAGQFDVRLGRRIALHGGGGADDAGVFNAIYSAWDPRHGYDDTEIGSSFVMVTTFPRHGCVQDRSILTYGESENPRSVHDSDQLRLFSRKRWVDPAFCASEVRRTARSTQVISSR